MVNKGDRQVSKTREYIEKNAFKHDVIEMDYELLMGTIEAQKEEIVELKKTTIPISKLEELISISDGFDNYAYSKNDLRQLIKEVKG